MRLHPEDETLDVAHVDDVDSTRLWPDGTLTDRQDTIARLLGLTVHNGRVRCSVQQWQTVQAVVGLIEEGRGESQACDSRGWRGPRSDAEGLAGTRTPPNGLQGNSGRFQESA